MAFVLVDGNIAHGLPILQHATAGYSTRCMSFRYPSLLMTTAMKILNTIFPVFVMAGIGYAVAQCLLPYIAQQVSKEMPTTSTIEDGVRRFLHTFTFNVAGPPYILVALWTSTVALRDLGEPAAVAILMYIAMSAIAFAVAIARRWDIKERKAAVLALASTNCANYGLPVVLFAFGDIGLVLGAVYVVAHVLIHLTLGLGIASWSTERSFLHQLKQLLKFPYIYAIALGLLLRSLGITPPVVVVRSLNLIGEMWIPLMLLLLGMELARVRIATIWQKAALLTGLKLLLPPFIAWGVTVLLGITGITQAVLIVESSMPTAVNGLLVARQCNTRPDLVASTLLLSTIGSIVTLSILLAILG